jgi:hypothetical protein
MIDWGFIEALEGGMRLAGYVPERDGVPIEHSGVTICDGIDLGQYGLADFRLLHMEPSPILMLVGPYLGVRGMAAAALLADLPLTLTAAQAETLSAAVHIKHADQLRTAYDRGISPGSWTFDQIPSEAATVIASVGYQYGNLVHECPRFWHTALAADWGGMIDELENFGDNFKSRRYKEAEYLRAIVLV